MGPHDVLSLTAAGGEKKSRGGVHYTPLLLYIESA